MTTCRFCGKRTTHSSYNPHRQQAGLCAACWLDKDTPWRLAAETMGLRHTHGPGLDPLPEVPSMDQEPGWAPLWRTEA